MNWTEFFAQTMRAVNVESYAQLAPRLGVSKAAISHYATGKRVPQAWVVAAALKLQGDATPEKSAAQILRDAAVTSEERAFWKRMASAAAVVLAVLLTGAPIRADAYVSGMERATTGVSESAVRSIHYAQLWQWLRRWLMRLGICPMVGRLPCAA